MAKRWISTLMVVLVLLYQVAIPASTVSASETGTLLPPSNLNFENVTPDDGKLTWSAVFGATGYNVYEITEGQLILLGKTSSVSYSLPNLPEGTYRYVVSTLSGEGESGPSAPVSAEIVYPEMQAPTDLKSTIKNGNDIVLSWGASQYVEKYMIYQISETGERTLISTTNSKTYTISNVDEGSFTYAVTAQNELYGESVESDPLTVEVIHPVMIEPSNLSFAISNGSDVTLKWTGSAYATSYNIYEVINGELVPKQTVTGTSVKFTNVPAGEYTYKVFSNSDRFGESAEGSQIDLTVSSITMTAPENATATVQNVNDVVLKWNSVPYATEYKIYEVKDGERSFKNSVKTTSATYLKLPGGEYDYEIYSYSDRYGESETGSLVSFKIDSVSVNPPTELSHEIVNGNDIVLAWKAADEANSYKVYQVVDGQKVLKSTIFGTSVTFTNMPAGTYEYEVYSYSTRFGESLEGAKLSLSFQEVNLEAPTNVTYQIKNGNDLTFDWDAVEFASHYKLYQVNEEKKVLKATVSSTTATLVNQPEGNLQYEVYAYNSRFGESKTGTAVNVVLDFPEMASPTDGSFTPTSPTSFTLKWGVAEYANNYKVYQIIDGKKVLKSTVSSTSASFTNMVPGVYEYEVYSNSTRFGESQNGLTIEVALSDQSLATPGNVTTNIVNGNDLSIKWDAVQYATSYKLYQVIDGEEVFVRNISSRSTTVANVPEGEYKYVIKAYSSLLGESPIGAEVTGTMVFPEMADPNNLTYTVANGNDVTLKWNAVTYATSYKVYEIVNGEKILLKEVTSTSTSITNLPEKDYKYIVHSYSNRFGESAEGSSVEFNLTQPIMQKPENLSYTIPNGNDIYLKWTASTYAKEYRIYQMIDGEKILARTVTGTYATFVNMPEGEYEYIVHSYSDRFGESSEGSTIEFNLTWPIMQAPADLTKSITNGNDIVLRWKASTFAKQYKVYEVVDGELVLLKTVSGTSVTFANMPEGDYQYVVHSYSDRFNESPEGSSIEFNLTWPIVQPPVVTGKVFNANNITLTWPAVTWANEYRVYKVNGEQRELLYKGTARSFTVYNLTEDIHSFEVTGVSTRFGESLPSERIVETIVYPIMEPPTATLLLLSEDSARIYWDFVTYANGYNIYEIIDGEPVLIAEKVNNLSYTLTNLSYANHLYYVTSYSNSFGESKPSETVLAKLIVDTEAPVTTTNAPTEWVNESQTVTFEATDNEVGVEKTFYSLNGGADWIEGTSVVIDQEGENEILYYSVDKVGNKEEHKTAIVRIDKTAPETQINELPEFAQSVTVELNTNDEVSKKVRKTYYSINGIVFEGTSFVLDTEGEYDITYYSEDVAGNKESEKTVKVVIDQTSPVTAVDAPASWVNEDVTVTLTAEDAISGVDNTFYSINGEDFIEGTTFKVNTEGENKIRFYSIDSVGNKEEEKSITVLIDKSAPDTISNIPVLWVKDDVSVNLKAADTYSGVSSSFYSINGSDQVEGSAFVIKDEGIHQVTYFSVDKVGNREVIKTEEVKIDKSAPIVSINMAKEYGLGTTLALDYAAKDVHSGIVEEKVTLNGVVYNNGDEIILNKPGVYNLRIEVIDAVGHSTIVEKTFTVYVPIELEVLPKVIKGNNGVFTVKAELPKGYESYSFDISSVTLNGVQYDAKNKGLEKQAEKGHFKFNREDFTWKTGKVVLELRGYVGDILMVGKTVVDTKE